VADGSFQRNVGRTSEQLSTGQRARTIDSRSLGRKSDGWRCVGKPRIGRVSEAQSTERRLGGRRHRIRPNGLPAFFAVWYNISVLRIARPLVYIHLRRCTRAVHPPSILFLQVPNSRVLLSHAHVEIIRCVHMWCLPLTSLLRYRGG